MVQFSKNLIASQHNEFYGHYIDYKRLKKVLKQLGTDSELGHLRDKTVSKEMTEAFVSLMDDEIEKAVLFFLQKQGEYSSQLLDLRKEFYSLYANGGDIKLIQITDLADKYRTVADCLMRLIYYVELNVTAVRKILKKHDKHLQDDEGLTGDYLMSRVDGKDSHVQQLYHYEGITAIVTSIRHALHELKKMEDYIIDEQMDAGAEDQLIRRTITDMEPVLKKIEAARRRLKQSSTYIDVIAAQALIFEGEGEDSDEDLEANVSYQTFQNIQQGMERRTSQKSKISRFLNFASTFLYMMNYYIVVPTSAEYGMLVGGSAALSGTIIGMTPIAAMISAILYSKWANTSYKQPLLLSTVFLISGNLMYAMALTCDSFAFIIIGRLLNGFGGSRSITRRYVADMYSYDERTSGSAMFVTSGALGMAAGPAAAFLLVTVVPNCSPYLTEVTSPGWFMFILWCFYLIGIIFFFQEPNRKRPLAGMKSDTPNASDMNLSITDRDTALTQNTELQSTEFVEYPSKPHATKNLRKRRTVMLSLWIYLLLKLILECLLSSASTLLELYFNWKTNATSMYLCMLALLIFPANIGVGYMSFRYSDRRILVFSLFMMFLGVLTIVHYKFMGDYHLAQYFIAGMMIFVFCNVLESVNMSLLSKSIPKRWAKGTFNSGLLATEAGTLGRAIGDHFITIVGYQGMDLILNWTFVPCAIMAGITFLFSCKFYHYLRLK